MIAGVYPIDSGTVELDGKDISRLPEPARAQYLGRVFQDPMRGTAADMQIDENLALCLSPRPAPRPSPGIKDERSSIGLLGWRSGP